MAQRLASIGLLIRCWHSSLARSVAAAMSIDKPSALLVSSYRRTELNLFWPSAFNSVLMPVVAEGEQLPVRQARAQDPSAWDKLFKRYQLPLYAYVFEMVREEQSSLDIVQETFISAVRHIDSLRDDSKFGSWLFGIAHQKCLQRWRKNSRDAAIAEDISDSTQEFSEGPDTLLISREQEESFMRLLDELQPQHRSVLLLHYLEDFSIDEISRITQTTEGTVKSRLHYARKAMKKLWEGRDHEKTS